MKRETIFNTHALPVLKGQLTPAQGFGVSTQSNGIALGLETGNNEYSQMPEASNVYRETDVGIGSTPPGSNVFNLNIFYKHEVVSKVVDPVILNLFQDPNALYIRSRNKFGMTRFASLLTFKTASKFYI